MNRFEKLKVTNHTHSSNDKVFFYDFENTIVLIF